MQFWHYLAIRLVQAWWTIWLPGLALLTISLTGNLMGDWLRDALDPRLRQRALGNLTPQAPSPLLERWRGGTGRGRSVREQYPTGSRFRSS